MTDDTSSSGRQDAAWRGVSGQGVARRDLAGQGPLVANDRDLADHHDQIPPSTTADIGPCKCGETGLHRHAIAQEITYDKAGDKITSILTPTEPVKVKHLRALLDKGVSTDRIGRAVSDCWHLLSVEEGSGMQGYKLINRVNEGVRWSTPILTFTIDRHGAMVAGGSIYAEIQEWTVNLDAMTARYRTAGQRQYYLKEAAIKVGPIAKEIARAILAHDAHPYLTWAKNGSVKVDTNFLAGKKQTFEGRRKRLYTALTGLLGGWSRIGAYWRKEAATGPQRGGQREGR